MQHGLRERRRMVGRGRDDGMETIDRKKKKEDEITETGGRERRRGSYSGEKNNGDGGGMRREGGRGVQRWRAGRKRRRRGEV